MHFQAIWERRWQTEKVGDVMNAHEYLNFEMKFDLNNPYEPTNDEFLDMYSS